MVLIQTDIFFFVFLFFSLTFFHSPIFDRRLSRGQIMRGEWGRSEETAWILQQGCINLQSRICPSWLDGPWFCMPLCTRTRTGLFYIAKTWTRTRTRQQNVVRKKTRWQTHRIQIQVRLGDGIATWTGGDVPAGCALGHSHCPVRNANVQCLDGRSLDGVLGAMTRRELSLLSLLTFLPCSGSIRSFHQPGRIQPVNECWKCESTLSRTLCHICSLLYIRSRHINTRLGSDIIDRRPSGPRVSPPAPRSRPKTSAWRERPTLASFSLSLLCARLLCFH